MTDMFAALLLLCRPGEVLAPGGLWAGLFVAGAAGSAAHCVPMCGGFVLGQTADRVARIPAAQLCEWRRLTAAALLPYHLGRLSTYAALGALAASSAAVLGHAPWLRGLSAALLGLAALVFLAEAASRLHAVRRPALPFAALWSRVVAGAVRRVRGAGAFPLGLALGLLPCGFLYGALLAAASAGSAVDGAISMVAFGLGTVPALIVVAVAGEAAGRRWRGAARAVAPFVFGLSGLLLLGLAVRQAGWLA